VSHDEQGDAKIAVVTQAELHMGQHGRIVIPAEMRRALGIGPGSTLVATLEEGGRIVLEDRQAAARRERGSWKALAGGRDLVADLLSHRRAEAALEDAEAEGDPAGISRASAGVAQTPPGDTRTGRRPVGS
jgi:AbrB family looped-hinge helix DNA binding protein